MGTFSEYQRVYLVQWTETIDFTNENDRFDELNFRQYKLHYIWLTEYYGLVVNVSFSSTLLLSYVCIHLNNP